MSRQRTAAAPSCGAGVHASAFVHPHALVEDAAIGPRSKVWQFASVIRGARLGADCVVGSCATLDGPHFGDRCIVSPGVDIGPGFEMGDDVFVGPNVVLCNDRFPRVAKDGFRYDLLRRGFVTVRVKSGASIGANAVVLPGVTIGARAMVAAGAVVQCDVPDDYLFHRDGSLHPIHGPRERMREARKP